MKFKTKRDPLFIALWAFVIVLINAVFLIPLLTEEAGPAKVTTLLLLDLAISALFLWIFIDISYVFTEDFLLVKGGIFRSKIRYKDITWITENPNLWVGYRLIGSSDAIEIAYKSSVPGSVVISPVNKEEFIRQLLARNSSIRMLTGK